MKAIVEFVKSTFMGGFLVLLPVLLLWGVFKQAFNIALKIATPILDLLPKSALVDTPKLRELAALLLLVGGAFLCGLLLRATFLRRASRWVEARTLDRLPGYTMLKSLISDAIQPEAAGGFRPAMLTLSEGMQRPAYVIEDHGDGNFTVFLPSAPAAFSGMVHVVSAERIVFLDVKLHELVRSVAQFGAGLGGVVKRNAPKTLPPSRD